jgi:hypothetical protein
MSANEHTRYTPLEFFQHYDHGKDADAAFPNLLKDAKVEDLTANIGAEIRGVQLSKLTDKGKDELALFVAQKKVVGKFDATSLPNSTDKAKPSVTRTLPTSTSKMPSSLAVTLVATTSIPHPVRPRVTLRSILSTEAQTTQLRAISSRSVPTP